MMTAKIKAILAILTVSLTGIATRCETINDLYSVAMIVTELDEENDTVIMQDANGNIWSFEGIEDWFVGDLASVMLDKNGTQEIYDDTIVKVRYTGVIDYFEDKTR